MSLDMLTLSGPPGFSEEVELLEKLSVEVGLFK